MPRFAQSLGLYSGQCGAPRRVFQLANHSLAITTTIHPTTAPPNTPPTTPETMTTSAAVSPELIAKVTAFVETYMSNYDGSHDFHHIRRVLALAKRIQATLPSTNADIVTLSALLHDVGDKKYLKPGEDSSRLVHDTLVSFGAESELAEKVQAICLGVSYSSEVKDPARVVALIKEHPELSAVQDADRLDAIGAVGVGRAFAFGGAKGRTLGNTMDHFDEKLVHLESMMKTEEGKKLARERTERIKTFQSWWKDEAEVEA